MHPYLIQLENSFNPSILTKVEDPSLAAYAVDLWVKRDDLLHPTISGNKWRKLKYILNHALSSGSETIISMGGAYSNHLHALAYIGQRLGIKTIGYIRGEQPRPLTPTLQDMQSWGMALRFVSRAEYRQLRGLKDPHDLPGIGPREYWLPEGGAVDLALQGIIELVDEITTPYDFLCAPCGTGATLAGLIEGSAISTEILGIAALKNASFVNADVQNLLAKSKDNWQINHDYHFGGFAKTSAKLQQFIENFTETTHIPLEPIYTGKMMFALYDLIKSHTFTPGQRIVAVHTGGLQGNRGFAKQWTI